MIGWSETGASYNFTTLAGGGTLAGSFTANSTTTTWVPLLDASGSTIGLVNAANVGAGPATTYTYDPSGTPTQSGTSNPFWPFQYQGMEQEYIDAPYYYSGSGQFYSPRLVRSLSEVGQTSSQSAGGLAGNAVAAPSGGNGSNPGSTALAGASAAGDAATAAYFAYADIGAAETLDVPVLALALAATSIYETVEFFLDLLGSSHPMVPRQLLHELHPLYDLIVGILKSLTPDESSAAEGSADPFTVSGVASFYYPDPTGKTGCKGYSYTDAEGFTAAMHKEIVGPNGKFPCGTTANVTYSPPGGVPRTIAVRVIDHGPYDKEGRVIDLSPGAFKALAGSLKPGTIPVTVTFPEGPKAPLQAGD